MKRRAARSSSVSAVSKNSRTSSRKRSCAAVKLSSMEVPRRFGISGRTRPLQQRERRVGVVVVFEHAGHRARRSRPARADRRADCRPANVVGVGQFDEHHEIRALILQRRMHRMPDALVAVDDAARRGLFVAQVEAQAAMADPLRSPLPAFARAAALQQQLLFARALPERRVETVGRGDGSGETGLQIRRVIAWPPRRRCRR